MTNLFDTAAVFGDIHFGKKGNSKQFNKDCSDFIDFFIAECKKMGIKTCIFLGDWHDNRQTLHISTLNYSIENLKKLNDAFETVYAIIGNHDMFYKDRRDVTSVVISEHLPNVVLIDDFLHVGNVTFCPWLVGTEWKTISDIAKKSDYIFGHFEIPKFLMNVMVEMSDHGEISAEHFDDVTYMAFTGHFHKRQAKGKVCYIGSPMPHDYADAWDDERGFMVLDWGKTPRFIDWKEGPRYRSMRLSELLENPVRYVNENTYTKISTDLDLTYEEVQYIKESFLGAFQVRSFDISNGLKDSLDQDFNDEEGEFQTLDQIVVDGLLSVESIALDTNKLISLYQEL